MLLTASQPGEQAALVLVWDRETLMLAKLPQVLKNKTNVQYYVPWIHHASEMHILTVLSYRDGCSAKRESHLIAC